MEPTPHVHQDPPPSGGQPIVFTEAALAKIREFVETKDEARGKALRMFVQGGGCSGFEYGFTFDAEKDGDLRVSQGGVDVLIDLFSLPYLEGCEVDYRESLMGGGFSVRNPNAAGTCGCGHSFTT